MDSKKQSYIHVGTDFDASLFVIVTFYLEVYSDFDKCVEAVAAESSIGSWVKLHALTDDIFKKFSAKVFEIKKYSERRGTIKVAYPIELFETDNIPQLLTDIGGSVFGIRSIKNLRIKDISLPESFVNANKRPVYGISGLRDVLKVYDRPIIATTIKPKFGLSTQEYIKLVYESWSGGADIVMDDVKLADHDSNPFYDRLVGVIEARRKAEHESGQMKLYYPNISARIGEMYARGKFVREMGGRAVLIDIFSVGFSGLQFIRDQGLGLILYGSRAMHGAFVHTNKHGISMSVFAKLIRLSGIDMLQIGSVFNNKEGNDTNEEVDIHTFLQSQWFGLKPIMPLVSGGLHPGVVPDIYNKLGKDIVIHFGGAIHGHPDGSKAGAKAVKQALEAVLAGVDLNDASSEKRELKKALGLWGASCKDKGKSNRKSTYVHSLVVSSGLDLIKKEKGK